MELAAKYAYQIYKSKSFTLASKELFISQPALSAMIAKLEEELGFKIFNRRSSPLSLTGKGKIYIESLEEIIESENVMKRRIEEFDASGGPSVSVGGYCSSLYVLFPKVYERFRKRLPNARVMLDLGHSGMRENLFEKLQNGWLDLIFSYHNDIKKCRAIPLHTEYGVFAVNRNMPEVKDILRFSVTREELITGTYPKEKELEDVSLLGKIPFLAIEGYREKSESILGKKSFTDGIRIDNSRNIVMHCALVKSGACAIMIYDYQARNDFFVNDDIVYFVPKKKEKRTLYLLEKEQSAPNEVITAFIEATLEAEKEM